MVEDLTQSQVCLAMDSLFASIDALGPQIANMPAMAYLTAHCRRAAPAWPVRLTRENVDRRGAILSGPLFTSSDHPWPAASGIWLEPVLQIDLASLGVLAGQDLGEDWLQVWMGSDGGFTRILPATVLAAALTPVPSLDAQSYCQRLRVNGDPARPEWLEDGRRIVGFDEPFFDYGANELLGYIEVALENENILPVSLGSRLRALGRAIETDPNAYRFQHRAFGAVNESDLAAISVPPVLFVFEEDEPLRESLNGNDGVYVCYERSGTGDIAFSVHGWNLRE
jgi:hypothetical protein